MMCLYVIFGQNGHKYKTKSQNRMKIQQKQTDILLRFRKAICILNRKQLYLYSEIANNL